MVQALVLRKVIWRLIRRKRRLTGSKRRYRRRKGDNRRSEEQSIFSKANLRTSKGQTAGRSLIR